MTIVMGVDQHRGQITAEWIETETGEVSRARVAPAHREPVRRFFGRFRGEEPAETSARRGSKRRAKSDRADARQLRELMMVSGLPESWIPPDHILDLRARVRLRHTLSQQRGEWQQRIRAVLYHHGLPQRRDLLTRENRAWVERAALPDTAREQVTVALAMIDGLDARLAPITRDLRAYGKRRDKPAWRRR